MNRLLYLLKNFFKKFLFIFNFNRIKKFGVKFALLDFGIFLMHRNNSKLEHYLIRKKDEYVQMYLEKNYSFLKEEMNNE